MLARVFLALSLLATLIAPAAFASDDWYAFFDRNFTVRHYGKELFGNDIQVGVLAAAQARGTVIYMPGFADTIDNHEALLKGFRDQGLNVIAFDYPEHGKSTGAIRWWNLEGLARIIPTVLADARSAFDPALPVILAGWSTGATISVRIAQDWGYVLPRGTRLAGVVAYAPALPAQMVIEVKKSRVTDGEMKRGPQPEAVPVLGEFATSITLQSRVAAAKDIPAGVSALILVGGDADQYAQSEPAVRWVKRQGANVAGFRCVGAMHGFEFQPKFGREAQAAALDFAVAAARGDISAFQGREGAACPRILK